MANIIMSLLGIWNFVGWERVWPFFLYLYVSIKHPMIRQYLIIPTIYDCDLRRSIQSSKSLFFWIYSRKWILKGRILAFKYPIFYGWNLKNSFKCSNKTSNTGHILAIIARITWTKKMKYITAYLWPFLPKKRFDSLAVQMVKWHNIKNPKNH